MGRGHPECPERLDAIEDRLLVTGVATCWTGARRPIAPLADIELAHGRMHVAALRGLSDQLRDEIEAGGPTHARSTPTPPSTSTPGMRRCVRPVPPSRPPTR
jgi:acetoin utilization deacetylase AcuC-like enzyme